MIIPSQTAATSGLFQNRLAQFGDLQLFLDMSNITSLYQDNTGLTPVTATGQNVGLARDHGPKLHGFSQGTVADRPVYSAYSGLLNAPVFTPPLSFLNSIFALTSWRFLHDGSGFTMFVQGSINFNNSNQESLIWDNATQSNGQLGTGCQIGFVVDSGSSVTGAFFCTIVLGKIAVVAQAFAPNGLIMTGIPYIFTVRYWYLSPGGNDLILRVGGSQVAAAPTQTVPSTQSASAKPNIGCNTQTTRTHFYDGPIRRVVLYKGPISDTDLPIIEGALQTT